MNRQLHAVRLRVQGLGSDCFCFLTKPRYLSTHSPSLRKTANHYEEIVVYDVGSVPPILRNQKVKAIRLGCGYDIF
jgi:hypothetical protein